MYSEQLPEAIYIVPKHMSKTLESIEWTKRSVTLAAFFAQRSFDKYAFVTMQMRWVSNFFNRVDIAGFETGSMRNDIFANFIAIDAINCNEVSLGHGPTKKNGLAIIWRELKAVMYFFPKTTWKLQLNFAAHVWKQFK